MVHHPSLDGGHIFSNAGLLRKAARWLCCFVLFLAIAPCRLSAQGSAPASSSATPAAAASPGIATSEPYRHEHDSDTVAYWFGSSYRTPSVVKPGTDQAADIARNSIEYTHAGSWGIVSNFADVMVNLSDMAEPASGGGSGATEIYTILRSNVGLDQASHSNTFRKGPLHDVTIELGANLETKNSSYAPSEKTIYIGSNLQFVLERGFFNMGLHFRKEWNHQGVLGRSESYNPDFNIEPTWMLPVQIGKLQLAYSGFADYNTPKGKDSFGTATAGEFLIRSAVAADVGNALLHRPRLLDLSGGFWYWHNMYGKPSSVPGSAQMTPIIGMVLHLEALSPRHN